MSPLERYRRDCGQAWWSALAMTALAGALMVLFVFWLISAGA